MCWNRIIHMLVRSTWSVLQRDTGADPNWDAASAAIRGRRAGLKRRSTLSQSIFPSLTLSMFSPRLPVAAALFWLRLQGVCICSWAAISVCVFAGILLVAVYVCVNVICTSAQQLLSWHYAVCLYTHTYSYWTLLKHHLLSAHTLTQTKERAK